MLMKKHEFDDDEVLDNDEKHNYIHNDKVYVDDEVRDVRKIGPQLGIYPISGHFWPKIGLGLGWGLKIFKNCGQGWGWGCKIKKDCG